MNKKRADAIVARDKDCFGYIAAAPSMRRQWVILQSTTQLCMSVHGNQF